LKTGLVTSISLLASVGAVLSAMSLPHTAYLAAIMVPIAGLAGMGAVLLLRSYREVTVLRFALPVTIILQTVWCLVLLASFPEFAAPLDAPVALLGFGGAAALAANALRPTGARRVLAVVTALAVVGVLLAPTVWALSTLNPAFAGTANDAYGGPQVRAVAARKLVRHAPYGIGLDSNRGVQPTEAIEKSAFDYARGSGNARWALATDSWRSAAPLILQGHSRVLPMGGYTSRIPAPTLTSLKGLVASGQLHFVLLTPAAAKTGVYNPNLSAISRWVSGTCRLVPPSQYVGPLQSRLIPSAVQDRLFDCRPIR
jgi:hypothetical protein